MNIQPLRLRPSFSIPQQTCHYDVIIIQNSSTIYSLIKITSAYSKIHKSRFYLQRLDNDSATNIPCWISIFELETNSFHQLLGDDPFFSKTNFMSLFNYQQCQLLLPVLFHGLTFLNNNPIRAYPIQSTTVVHSKISNKERLYFFKHFYDRPISSYTPTYYSRSDYMKKSILIVVDVANDVVRDVLNLNDSLYKFLLTIPNESTNIDHGEIVVWDMKNKENECHMLIQFYLQSKTIYHISHNIDSNEFKFVCKYPQQKRPNCRSIMISTGSILFVSENVEETMKCCTDCIHKIQFRWYNQTVNQWLPHGYITSKMCINLDCCVFVKGNYCVIFTAVNDVSQGIFLLDLKQQAFIHVDKTQCNLLRDDSDFTGPYKAILQSSENIQISIMNGFVRDIVQLHSMRFPPHYLIKLLSNYYSNEKIYLMRKLDMEDILWILNVDDLFP